MRRLAKAIRNPGLVLPYFKDIANNSLLGKIDYSFWPRRIAIAVNSVCNMRCVMCDIGQGQTEFQYYKNVEAGATLDLKVFENLINQVNKFSPMISFNLTEPLLNKNITSFIECVIKNKMRCEVVTNGYLLGKFAEEFVEVGLPSINISIDGPPEVHNLIRGMPDSFEKAYEGIQQIIGAKRELNKELPKIYIAFAISNYNSHCLEDTARIFKDSGVAGIAFTHLNFISESMAKAHNNEFGHVCKVRPSSISVINPEDVDEFVLTKQIELVKEKYPDFAGFSPDLGTLQEVKTYYKTTEFLFRNKCFTPWRNAQILSNGDVIPLSRCFHIVMGNIHERNFKEIWNGAVARNFRKELRKIGATPACSRCCAIY